MKYLVPAKEMVSAWQNVDLLVDTEDSIEEVYKRIKDGTFVSTYLFDEISSDIIIETMESITYDYSNIEIEDIKEL